MKTTKTTLIAMMFTLAAVISGNSAEAQRRDRDNHNDKHVRVKRYKDRDHKDHDNRDRDQNHRYNNHDNIRRDHDYHYDNQRQYKHSNCQPKYHHNHSKYQKHHDYHYYKKQRGYERDCYDWRYCYRHPRHGIVYRKFSHAPVRFRHGNCDYYYHEGYYYRRHHGVGYVRVELPGNMVIERLPERCEHFTHHGRKYYRNGDLIFERYGHGFRIIPNFNLTFMARF